MVGDGGALPGEHPRGVGDQRLRVVPFAGGFVDAGDDDRPQPVGGDLLGAGLAEDVFQRAGPRRPQLVTAGGGAAGEVPDVRSQTPPQGPGGPFGGQRRSGGRRGQQRGDVDPGTVGQRQSSGQHRPIVVPGDLDALVGQDVGPPVGAVAGITAHRQGGADQFGVAANHRDPPRGGPGGPNIGFAHRFGGPPHREVTDQLPVG